MRYLILALITLSSAAFAKLETKVVEYKEGDVTLEGYLAYDTKFKGPRPGVLVVHEWMGLDGYAKSRTEQLAKLGYIAFAADIFGKGVRPSTMDEAAKISSGYKANPELWRARAVASLETLKAQKNVDGKKIAAIGYCFGGSTVLEFARAGTELNGVVSFHGNFATKLPVKGPGIVKTKVLVLHGANDPFVKQDEYEDFIEEMQKSKADWQMISYGNAVHKFSNPEAGNDPSKGFAYDKSTDERSWAAMQTFFKEIF
jgi:dienelactone hydrolase